MPTTTDLTLRAELEFLARPDSYPEPPERVDVVETHYAWVLLAGPYAYKLKKPIRFRELDFSTVAARRAACELEVALNRRLTTDVYLGVLPLGRVNGGFALGSAADPVDWLVKMRRLPAERSLDELARRGAVGVAELARLVERLAAYYAGAARAAWNGAEYRAALELRIARYGADLERACVVDLDGGRVRALTDAQLRFVRDRTAELDARIAEGRVLDAHGDLKPEHVFFCEDVEVIDCLEFSAELRLLDTAEEISFLALELDRFGHPELGRSVVELYRARAADRASRELLGFYRSLRALVRALLAALHVADARDGEGPRWRAQADWYLSAALEAVGGSGGGRRAAAGAAR